MNPQAKALRRENNNREQELSPAARQGMTDVVVYLRSQDLSQLAQEEIRQDIQEMILEGEKRGETMEQVIGEDYRAFCDEIVAAVPRRPRLVRFLGIFGDLLPALSVLMGIWVVNKVVHTLLAGNSPLHLTLTVGEMISMVVILAAGIGAVEWICRTALDKPRQEKKGTLFLRAWLVLACVAAGILLPTVFWKKILCTLWLPVALVVACLPVLLSLLLSRRRDL